MRFRPFAIALVSLTMVSAVNRIAPLAGLEAITQPFESLKPSPEVERVEPQAPPLLLTNAWLIDGTSAPVVENAWVRIEGDRIAAVGHGTPPSIPDALVMNLQGRTVLPGLMDTHVHLRYLEQARWMLKLLLAHGITTVKDTGSSLGNVVEIRRWMEGEESVPRVYVSGPILSGSQDDLQFLKEEDGTAILVQDNVSFGVDFIKTHNWVSSQALRQIVRFAKGHGLYVTGHVPLGMTSIAAIDAGLRIIMHTSTLRASEVLDDPELVARYPIDLPYPLRWGYWAHFDPKATTVRRTLDAWEKRKQEFFFEPTLAVLEGMASTHDPEGQQKLELQRLVSPLWRKVWRETPPVKLNQEQIVEARAAVAGMVAFAGLANAQGIRIVTGTDSAGGPSWVVAGDSLHRELELLVEAGLSPVEAVRCSTSTAAEALTAPNRGTIARGKRADLVIARGNVSADISAIREIELVMLGGRLHRRTQLLEEAAGWAEEHQTEIVEQEE